MKRPSKIRIAVLTLALAAFCLSPAAGKADYYPWGSSYWPGYTSYYPGYTAGYFPNYWDGYYSGGLYTAGYYPVSWSSYYAPSCGSCGSCGWSGCGSCSYGCGSCGLGCGSCGSGCGSCGVGYGSCGGGYGSCGVGCGTCGVGCCGSSCGTGLACGSCGSGSPTGSDCGGSPPARAGKTKTAPPDADDKFEARPSPTYDDPPTPRSKRKAPPETPPGGGASLDVPGNDTPPPTKFTRDKATDDTKTGTPPAGGDKFTTPVPATKPPAGGGSPAEQPFGANKPTGPAPDQPKQKHAPMPNVPGAAADDEARSGSMASGARESDVFANNPALALQEQPTWSYSGSVSKAQRPAATRVASVGSPVPRRIKSPVLEPAVRVVQNVVRN
jgi:hypothetical protein